MAEEENEILDWGNEDDVVSLGDEDERYAFEDPVLPAEQNGTAEPSTSSTAADPSPSSSVPPINDKPSTPTPDPKPTAPTPEPRQSSKQSSTTSTHTSQKLTIPPRLTHALPAKPVTTNIPYVPPSDPSIVEATAMASRPKKVDSSGHELKDGSRYDHIGPLPPQWEIRFSRDRPSEFYYYNVRQTLATWDRPQNQSASAPATDTAATTLSHDDRHYRPEGRNTLGSSRRYETPGDASDARHTRQHAGSTGRSPPRGRERSRSSSPQRDSRSRGSQRPTRGRPNIKSNGSHRDSLAADAPRDEDRHWAPSPAPSVSRSARRQQIRAQTQSANESVVDSLPENPVRLPPREAIERGNNHGRDHTITLEHSSNNITAPRPETPHQEEGAIIYQTEPRREVRPRSPGPGGDPNASPPTRRDRPSRFGPGNGPTSSLPERINGLPMKPSPAIVERSNEFARDNDRHYERRLAPERPAENVPPQYVLPPNRSPVQPREPWNGDRGRASPVRSENSGSSSSRKRQPLPPQEAQFRGIVNPKPSHLDVPVSHSNDLTRSPPLSYQTRENLERTADSAPPPHPPKQSYSSHSNREADHRDVVYGPPLSVSRELPASDYHRGYEHEVERLRTRQHQNDQNILDRGFELLEDHPPGRAGFSERERDPPSKPRAMQGDSAATSSAYANTGPYHTNRYRDRPSPPHLAVDSRGESETRPGSSLAVSWQDRRDEKSFAAPERGPTRESRVRQAPTSSANSIPIGTRRSFSSIDTAVADYPLGAPNDHFERQGYPANDAPRQTRNYNPEYSRTYPQKEPVSESRQALPRISREDSYMQPPYDDRTRRTEITEPPQRIQAPLSSQPPENNSVPQQRQSHFLGPRNSRFDPGQLPDPPPQQHKAWSSSYDTSPRRRYDNDPARDPTPPPLSRDSSYTSPHWDPPSPNYRGSLPQTVEYQETHEYRNLSLQTARMDIDPANNRQAPIASIPQGTLNQPTLEQYRRKEVENEVFSRAPPAQLPRGGHRKDPSLYSPEDRRVPASSVPLDGVQRGGGSRLKWEQAGLPVDEQPHKRIRLNDRLSDVPLASRPDMRSVRKPQGNSQDNRYNGEPDTYEVRASGRMESYAHLPAKPFVQRLDLVDRPLMSRGASLLSRISHGSDDALPPPSLRDRVHPGNKREREEMARGNFSDVPFEADEGDPDSAGARKRNKRRRARRGGGPG